MHLLLLVSFITVTLSSPKDIEVLTPKGTIIGKSTTYSGSPLHEFFGIPFAEPPIGDLRFRKTRPLKTWASPLFAQTMPPACPQYTPYDYPWYDKKPCKSEDCLYLNIWVPGFASQEKKAVMFWIHGGGFTYGSNRLELYNGKILAAENDVIVVSPNFRLGVLGFFTSDSDLAPGNMGVYDILEALKWVNNNIEHFGGDSKKVTVFGESSGALTTGLFCVSPLSKNLFQRAILKSRSPVEYSDRHKESNLRLGQRLAEALGCTNNETTLQHDPGRVVDCLKRINAEQLVTALNSLNPTGVSTFNVIFGDELFPMHPKAALLSGNINDVSVFLGFNQDEGSFNLMFLDSKIFGAFGEKNPYFNKTVGSKFILDALKMCSCRGNVVQHYLGNVGEYDYHQVREQTYHALGDFSKVCPVIYFGNSFAKVGKDVYFYYFNHKPSVSEFANWLGAYHFSQVQFIFGRPLTNEEYYTEEEIRLSKYMMALFANFAKYGQPTKNIAKSTPKQRNYINIRTNEWKSSYLKNHEENCHFYQTYFEHV